MKRKAPEPQAPEPQDPEPQDPEPQDPWALVTSEAVMERLGEGFRNVKQLTYDGACLLQMTYDGKPTIIASAKPQKLTSLMLEVSILGKIHGPIDVIKAYVLAINTNKRWHSVCKGASNRPNRAV